MRLQTIIFIFSNPKVLYWPSLKLQHKLTQEREIEKWEKKSLELIRKATINEGIKASCGDLDNYGAVFTRDAVMAGIAGILYEDETIINGFKNTIKHLHKTKGNEGQIASNYKILDGKIDQISFGTLSPKIDSATWYLVGIGILNQKFDQYELTYVESTIRLLDAIEYNGKHLMYIPQGGNWADEYPFEGYILYDQVLRAWALSLLGKQYGRNEWIKKSKDITEKINTTYYNPVKGYYNCTFTPAQVNSTFDFAAHNLMGLQSGMDNNDEFQSALNWINDQFLSKGKLPGAFYPVITEKDNGWSAISNFHLFEFKNKPYHYHNGGIWLIWLGWYALTLQKHQKLETLKKLAKTTFKILERLDSFNFEEYLSADKLNPCGTKELCYSATGILFLCKALRADKTEIDLFKTT